VDLSQRSSTPVLPKEGLLTALDQMDTQLRRVAVIEDNVDAARLIQRLLQARGAYDVQVAHNGEDGLKLVRAMHPDIIITDLMMPDVDGFTVIDTMKSDPELQHIPIVVITAKELTARERTRLNSQVDLLLKKGSSIDDDIVENLVHKLD
jgi:CheY-like chemotaxis protein